LIAARRLCSEEYTLHYRADDYRAERCDKIAQQFSISCGNLSTDPPYIGFFSWQLPPCCGILRL